MHDLGGEPDLLVIRWQLDLNQVQNTSASSSRPPEPERPAIQRRQRRQRRNISQLITFKRFASTAQERDSAPRLRRACAASLFRRADLGGFRDRSD
jgi:hypothetical protein